jgi:hypothetical protein
LAQRANEARANAEEIANAEVKRTMLAIADDYEKLAVRAADRPIALTKSGCLTMVRPGKAERDARIYARRKDGLTFAAIGREFNVTPETVRLSIKLTECKSLWREIEQNAQRERLARQT